MKKLIIIVVMMLMLVGMSMEAKAGLETIGTATYGLTDYNLIYDNDLQLTWFDYSNAITNWNGQNTWASGLNTVGTLTYNFNAGVSMSWSADWRLPTITQPDSTCALQWAGEGYGINCTGSEMGHLYYTELGNTGTLSNTGDFQELLARHYWMDTAYSALPLTNAWLFNTLDGSQGQTSNATNYYGIAVRSGEVSIEVIEPPPPVVPEPISSTLFLIGGATLGFRRFRKNFKK